MSLEDIFVGAHLRLMAKYGPEEFNVAAVVDRQIRTEKTVRSLMSSFGTVSPAMTELQQRIMAALNYCFRRCGKSWCVIWRQTVPRAFNMYLDAM